MFSFVLPAEAGAQESTDYKASYCWGRLKNVQVLRPSPSDPETVKELIRVESQQIEHARSRMRAFVLGHLSVPGEGPGMIAAMRIGEREQREYVAAMTDCMNRANTAGTYADAAKVSSTCANEAGAPKLKECIDAQFMPF
jgi:hypothetical protein